jgi:hypothetical protein
MNWEKTVGFLHFNRQHMGAVVFGVEPEVKLVLFHREAVVKRPAGRTRRDVLIAPYGFADHIFLEVVHI